MNSRPYLGETVNLTKGEYTSIEQILDEIGLKTELEKMDFVIDPITKHLSLSEKESAFAERIIRA